MLALLLLYDENEKSEDLAWKKSMRQLKII